MKKTLFLLAACWAISAAAQDRSFLTNKGVIVTGKLYDSTAVANQIAGKLSDPGGNGITSRTSSGTTSARTITGSAGISVNNGDGVSGNPALSVNINGLTGDTATLDDELIFSDVNASNTVKKISVQQLLQTYSKLYRLKVGYEYFGEYVGGTISTTISPNDVAAQNSGTGAASSLVASGIANRPGIIRSTTGTTATGRSGVSSSLGGFFLGGGTWVYEAAVNVATLSNGTDRYQLTIGFVDNFSGPNQTDGVYFLYDEGGVSTGSAASANWQIVTSSNSVRTFTTTSTAIAAATWVTLRIEVNAAGNRVDFFINGTNVGNRTTNIPAAAGRELGYGWGIVKSVGTTARTVDVDYLLVQNIFTSQR